MAVEARMIVTSKMQHRPSGATHQVEYDDGRTGETVELQQHDIVLEADVNAADDATKQWSVFTPSAKFEICVMNPEAAKYFEPGQDYRVIIQKRLPQQSRTGSGSYGEVEVQYEDSTG